MKLQSFDLRLLCITFYIIQRTSKIMHNLYPNPKTYLGMSFNRSLKYLKTLPYFRFISLYLWIQMYHWFLHQTMSHNNSICKPPLVHIPLVYLVPPSIIPLRMCTLLEDILVLTVLWFISIFPLQSHNSIDNSYRSLLDPYRKGTSYLHSLFTIH